MNNTATTEGRTDTDRIVPRAVLHKQILDTAEQRPGTSMEELAEEISFATTDLVERVLNEYGDPEIEDDEETADEKTMTTEKTGPEHEPSIDRDDEPEGDDDVSEVNSAPPSVTDGIDNDAIHDEIESESNDDAMIYHEGAVDHDHGPDVSTEDDDSQSERQSASDVGLSDLTEKQQETILAIFGNGRQAKSFMHIDDCIDAGLHVQRASPRSPSTSVHERQPL